MSAIDKVEQLIQDAISQAYRLPEMRGLSEKAAIEVVDEALDGIVEGVKMRLSELSDEE